MIPKVIHYCWFGHHPLSSLAKKCIKSWKRYFPDYEIKEWNEKNFDVNILPYTKEAYEEKRYAFVSDYARFWILYNYGGVYFDTDVEVIRPMTDIIERGAFMGCETVANKNIPLYVNPGLGLGLEAGNKILGDLLHIYSSLHFINHNGTQNLKTIVQYTSEHLMQLGLKKSNEIQCINNIYIYPKEYFNPYDCVLNKMTFTNNTRTIHYFAASWKTKRERFMEFVEKHFGKKTVLLIHSLKVLILKK